MIERIRNNRRLQLLLGLLVGICFGFLLQRAGITRYERLLGQLLLQDWTVVKVLLTAVLTGMLGTHLLARFGIVRIKEKRGAWGATAVGGLVFGVGFGLLGYCPGTMAGAVGQGSLDALAGGVPGMLLGSWIYTVAFDRLNRTVLQRGAFQYNKLQHLLGWDDWRTIFFVSTLILAFLLTLEAVGW
jgi:hypothetical protein